MLPIKKRKFFHAKVLLGQVLLGGGATMSSAPGLIGLAGWGVAAAGAVVTFRCLADNGAFAGRGEPGRIEAKRGGATKDSSGYGPKLSASRQSRP